jgi:hypothetical protein
LRVEKHLRADSYRPELPDVSTVNISAGEFFSVGGGLMHDSRSSSISGSCPLNTGKTPSMSQPKVSPGAATGPRAAELPPVEN